MNNSLEGFEIGRRVTFRTTSRCICRTATRDLLESQLVSRHDARHRESSPKTSHTLSLWELHLNQTSHGVDETYQSRLRPYQASERI